MPITLLVLAGFLAQAPAAQPHVDAIRAADRARIEALLRGDAGALERIYAPEYTMITPDGDVFDRAQQLGELRSGFFRYESARQDEVVVRVYGEAAVMISREVLRLRLGGRSFDSRVRFLRVYVRRNEAWQLAVSQATRLAG